MKKGIIFLVITLFLFNFFACDLQIPTAVEIKGTPQVSFGVDFDLGDIFRDNLDKLFDNLGSSGLERIKCSNTPYHTFMFYKNLFNANINLENVNASAGISQEMKDFLASLGIDTNNPVAAFNLDADKTLSDGNISLPIGNAGGDFPSFNFKDGKIILNISGSGSLADLLWVELKVNGVPKSNAKINNSSASRINEWRNNGSTYSGTGAPAGISINMDEISLGATDVTIAYRVYIKAGTRITPADLSKTATVKAEAILWLPLVLKATGAGANFEFDDLFDGDLFGREKGDDFFLTDYIDSLSLALELNNNPFPGATLNIVNTVGSSVLDIPITLIGNSLKFDVNKNLIEEINLPKNHPFCPVIKFNIPNGATLAIPRNFDLGIKQLTFAAGFSYRIDLQEGN